MNGMLENEDQVQLFESMFIRIIRGGKNMDKSFAEECGDRDIEEFYKYVVDGLDWLRKHKIQKRVPDTDEYDVLCLPGHTLGKFQFENIAEKLKKGKELAYEYRKNRKPAKPIRNIEEIINRLIPNYVSEIHKEDLTNIFSYGKIYRNRVEWSGTYAELQSCLKHLFDEQIIPHIHSKDWIHFTLNNFTKKGKDLSEKSVRNELTRDNWT